MFRHEHYISPDGFLSDQDIGEDSAWQSLFYETENSKKVARAVFMDLDPTVIDEARRGTNNQLFNPKCLLSGKRMQQRFGAGVITILGGKGSICVSIGFASW
mmetsp:Transcript_51314/g.58787  ORF Transcript_51314/g.58787 Transcript_51314/m.58787 type:complete len:102 (+) Transcript_51314:65-370(+)